MKIWAVHVICNINGPVNIYVSSHVNIHISNYVMFMI
jgi:hypothetical protein